MEGPTRTRLIAVALLTAVAVPLVVVAALGGGGDEESSEPPALRVERSAGRPELLLYVDDEAANRPERAKGRRSVTVECLDAGGTVVIAQREPWPLSDTDGNTLAPHAHVAVDPAQIGEVAGCRVRGTEPLLAGPVG